jgi:hypothetical protein
MAEPRDAGELELLESDHAALRRVIDGQSEIFFLSSLFARLEISKKEDQRFAAASRVLGDRIFIAGSGVRD